MNYLKNFLLLSILLTITLASNASATDEIIDKVADIATSSVSIIGNQDDLDVVDDVDLSQIESAAAQELGSYDAELIVLNKITAHSERILLPVEETRFFGNLSIEVNKCYIKDDRYRPDHLMLLTVFDNKLDDDKLTVFHGWVSASNPCISSLEHSVYEVIPLRCIKKEENEETTNTDSPAISTPSLHP